MGGVLRSSFRSRGTVSTVAAAIAVAVAAVVILALAIGHPSHRPGGSVQPGRHGAPSPSRPTRVEVTIARGAAFLTVPHSFLGLSTEYWTLPVWARQERLLERVVSLIRVPGEGPLIVRIGGDSADHSFWELGKRVRADWAFELTPGWLAQARRFLIAARARVILDLNLVTATPQIAADWAQAAVSRLPRGSIIGFEIGNEPDIYSRAYWLTTITGPHFATLLPKAISAASYAGDYRAYASVLHRLAPGVPLLGPALANPTTDAGWVSALLAGPHPALGAISVHRYPYDACVPRTSPQFPTLARLLSDAATAGMAASLHRVIALADQAALPVRITELNSITCGGEPGLSDSFATALWAPDALFELLAAGVDSVNIHVHEDAVNAAFDLTPAGLVANPLLYGLIAFARTLGPDARLVPVRLDSPTGPAVKVWAVSVAGNILHVLVIDKGYGPAQVLLRLPPDGSAAVQVLSAPSVRSQSGVSFGGRQLAADGRWLGPPAAERLAPVAAGYELTVRAHSAALISINLRPGELALLSRR